MTFVLDIGNVLIEFKPKDFLQSLLNDRELEEKMFMLIFKSSEWLKLDEGTITQEEAFSVFCEKEPLHKGTIEYILESRTQMLKPIHSTVKLLPEIKKAGHKLFYLSNYHKVGRKYILAEYTFFNLFDGGVFSCDVKLVKPSVEMFKLFLQKYRLVAEDCLFFDDIEENVQAAESVGMKGVLFRDAQDIERFI